MPKEPIQLKLEKIIQRNMDEVMHQSMMPYAEHVILECLGETIWRAQRQGTQMDALAYVDDVRRKASLI